MNRLCRCATAVLMMTSISALAGAESRPAAPADLPEQEGLPSSITYAREYFQPIENPISVVEQLHSLLFHWKPEYGGESDLDCFPAEDLATSFPEIIEWEVPGQVISGIRHERLGPLLVEAAKAIEVQVEHCYLLLHELAEQSRYLQNRVSEHSSRLNAQQCSIAELQAKVAAQECTIAELKKKDCQLEQSVAQLHAEIEALKALVQQMQGGEE